MVDPAGRVIRIINPQVISPQVRAQRNDVSNGVRNLDQTLFSLTLADSFRATSEGSSDEFIPSHERTT